MASLGLASSGRPPLASAACPIKKLRHSNRRITYNLHASDAARRRLAYMGMRMPNWLRARVLERSLLAQLLHPTTHSLHMQHDWTRGETARDHWPCRCCWQQHLDPARFPSHVSPPHNVPLASSPSSGTSSTSSSPAKKFHGNTRLVTP